MARAIGSGTISFGLVSVPVRLYTATRSKSLSYRLLHAKDSARVRQQYVCTACEKVVERDDLVRGFEYAKGQYAVLGGAELEALEHDSDGAIAIEEFVPIEAVDPIYLDGAHYLGPDRGAARPYRLLCQAMSRARRCAVALHATRGRSQLVLLRASGDVLLLHGLHRADEVVDPGEVDRGDAPAPRAAELDLAVKLIEQLASDAFDASKYPDEYRQTALALIERKVAGKEVVVAKEARPSAKVIDLMDALRASLAPSRRTPKAATPRKPPARMVRGREKTSEPARKRKSR